MGREGPDPPAHKVRPKLESVTGLSSIQATNLGRFSPKGSETDGTMFAWPTWQEVASPESEITHKMNAVRDDDYYKGVGKTIVKPTLKTGIKLQAATVGAANQHVGGMTYGEFMKGFLATGEIPRFVGPPGEQVPAVLGLSGTTVHALEPTSGSDEVDFLLHDYPKGQAIITNQRLLLFACEPDAAASFDVTGQPSKGQQKGHVEIQYSNKTTIWYKPIPLDNLRSIEIVLRTGATSRAIIKKPTRCGAPFENWWCLCCQHCCGNYYKTSNFTTTSENERCILIHMEGVAWGEKQVLKLLIDEDVPVQDVQVWAACLQASCTKMGAGLQHVDFTEDEESRAQRLVRLEQQRLEHQELSARQQAHQEEHTGAPAESELDQGLRTVAMAVGLA